MNDVTAIPILRLLYNEHLDMISRAMRKRSLSQTEKRELSDNHRAIAQAIDRGIGALQYRIKGKELSE